ncbi:MAG: hypothetical protein A2939_04685 [Parcubacteria group bacterium RIFCSPLOWO2_01_FULL_48_18]|nr:MAG: hypothetical protein A2939_04685 [Parcubacteria group bacterium RIFCSPLOWO2_01_FULL_48_18]
MNIPEEFALCFLGILVETGKTALIKSATEDRLTQEDTKIHIENLRRAVSEESYFKNQSFAVSLWIALAHTIATNKGVKPAELRRAFENRLSEIFPAPLAERLFRYTFKVLEKRYGEVKSHEDAIRELEEHRKNRRAILTKYGCLSQISPTKTRLRGTDTWFVPCPQCKLEKRCDKNTKKFHCACGFKSAYPFPLDPAA